MKAIFNEIPVDADTDITFESHRYLGEFEVVLQNWRWDGINASSFIFDSTDVALLEDAQLLQLLDLYPGYERDTSTTIKRSDSGLTFVNFNFSG